MSSGRRRWTTDRRLVESCPQRNEYLRLSLVIPRQSKFLVFIGVLLGMFGLSGIVMERKLSN